MATANTTASTTDATEATTYLTAHGYTHTPGPNWYDHASGYARVEPIDAEAGCFTVYAFTHDRARLLRWQVQLYHAPLSVFAATVNAATGR